MESWESSSGELPTKFNKYKRLREREKLKEAAESAAESVAYLSQHATHSCSNATTSSSSSSVSRCSPSVPLTRHQQQQQQQHADSGNSDSEWIPRLNAAQSSSCSLWQCNSVDGSLPAFTRYTNSDRADRPDTSTTDQSQQLPAGQSGQSGQSVHHRHTSVASATDRWLPVDWSVSEQRNGVVTSGNVEQMMDISDDMPLNLTVRVGCNSRCTTTDSRRTVLTLGEQTAGNMSVEPSSTSVVDEHFERSLGAEYLSLLKYPTAPSSAPPPTTHTGTFTAKHDSLCVIGAVDDHFRKSLGPGWHNDNPTSSVRHDSVDDHFARALGGDTWLRIKANHERSTSVPPYSSVHYYSTS